MPGDGCAGIWKQQCTVSWGLRRKVHHAVVHKQMEWFGGQMCGGDNLTRMQDMGGEGAAIDRQVVLIVSEWEKTPAAHYITLDWRHYAICIPQDVLGEVYSYKPDNVLVYCKIRSMAANSTSLSLMLCFTRISDSLLKVLSASLNWLTCWVEWEHADEMLTHPDDKDLSDWRECNTKANTYSHPFGVCFGQQDTVTKEEDEGEESKEDEEGSEDTGEGANGVSEKEDGEDEGGEQGGNAGEDDEDEEDMGDDSDSDNDDTAMARHSNGHGPLSGQTRIPSAIMHVPSTSNTSARRKQDHSGDNVTTMRSPPLTKEEDEGEESKEDEEGSEDTGEGANGVSEKEDGEDEGREQGGNAGEDDEDEEDMGDDSDSDNDDTAMARHSNGHGPLSGQTRIPSAIMHVPSTSNTSARRKQDHSGDNVTTMRSPPLHCKVILCPVFVGVPIMTYWASELAMNAI
ncbi:hypothetical protein OG21DRAFT_1525622 [Imleria badia]|nr:hypothetical protein OG21DRAFT_1525622 [Imleria badia]